MRLLAGLVAVMAGLPSTSSGSVGVAQASGLSARNRAISVRGGGDKQAELEALLGDDVVKKAKAANAPLRGPMPDKEFGGKDEEIAMNKQLLKQTGIQDYMFHREWVFDQTFHVKGKEPWRRDGQTRVMLNKRKDIVFFEREKACRKFAYKPRRVEPGSWSGKLAGVWTCSKTGVKDGGVFDRNFEGVLEAEVPLANGEDSYLHYQIDVELGEHYPGTVQFGSITRKGSIWKVNGFVPSEANTELIGEFKVIPRKYVRMVEPINQNKYRVPPGTPETVRREFSEQPIIGPLIAAAARGRGRGGGRARRN